MIPAQYENFFVASTQASAALTGLLFVSVTIAPERVFGGRAEAERQAQALSAFTALANVFFASFLSLIPNLQFGVAIVIIGAAAMSQTLSLLFLLPSWRREKTLFPGLAVFAISAIVYAFEIGFGIRLWSQPGDTNALTALLEILLGAYAIGLRRAWELLGAPYRRGLVSTILGRLRGRAGGRAASADGASKHDADKT